MKTIFNSMALTIIFGSMMSQMVVGGLTDYLPVEKIPPKMYTCTKCGVVSTNPDNKTECPKQGKHNWRPMQ